MGIQIIGLLPETILKCQTVHTARHAKNIMQKAGVDALPVVDLDGTLRGVVTDRELSFSKDDLPVINVMNRMVRTIDAGEDLSIAAKIMRESRLDHLVVIQNKQVIGVISAFDLLKIIEDGKY